MYGILSEHSIQVSRLGLSATWLSRQSRLQINSRSNLYISGLLLSKYIPYKCGRHCKFSLANDRSSFSFHLTERVNRPIWCNCVTNSNRRFNDYSSKRLTLIFQTVKPRWICNCCINFKPFATCWGLYCHEEYAYNGRINSFRLCKFFAIYHFNNSNRFGGSFFLWILKIWLKINYFNNCLRNFGISCINNQIQGFNSGLS